MFSRITRSTLLSNVSRSLLSYSSSAPSTQSSALNPFSFTQNRFLSIPCLAHKQPFDLHSKEFLTLQSYAMNQTPKFKSTEFSVTTLEKGTQLLGLTMNFDTVYGGIPLFKNNGKLTAQEIADIKKAMKKLGAELTVYTITEDIQCNAHKTASGDTRYYVCHDFLESSTKPIKDLNAFIAQTEETTEKPAMSMRML